MSKINSLLNQLLWNSSHPKIVSYVLEVSRKESQNYQTLKELPDKYLEHLEKLLTIYLQTEQLLELTGLDWFSPQVQFFFDKYPYGDRMPIAGWNDLYQYLEHEWFVNGGGF